SVKSSMDAFERHRAAVRTRLRESDICRAGRGSVSWRINAQIVVAASWGRAVLLQIAHPAIAAGVHDHSSFRGSFRSSVWRLRSTFRAMLDITFGDEEQVI